MGKLKARAAAGKKAAKAKVAPAVATTMSKRSTKKNERRKIAQKDRNAALCLRLQSTREADAAKQAQPNHFLAGGLLGALDVIASESPAPAANKNATNGRTNKGKRLLAAQESKQLDAVMHHPAFLANPVDTIFEHLNNTLPPGPRPAKPAASRKKKSRNQ